MERKDFVSAIERIISVDEGTLTGGEVLKSLEGWDSLAVLNLISFVDDNFGKYLEMEEVERCSTVDGLIDYIAKAVA